ncbi:MAG: thymidine kinase [Thermoanaerobaculales bacterium]|nr:thymidine kinase [Thermoanaerobaculales bacterium]
MRGTPGGGWIEVVAGPMFSGKSEELIRLLRRAAIARQRIQVFKPATDDRYSEKDVVSHSQQRLPCAVVEKAKNIVDQLDPRTDVIGIDEAQFFDEELPKVCGHLANLGKRVIVAGLDMDFRGIPFEPMPELLAIAEQVQKVTAVCSRCGASAAYTQRLVPSTERVVVGAMGVYEARCRRCHEPDGAPQGTDVWLFPPITNGEDLVPD